MLGYFGVWYVHFSLKVALFTRPVPLQFILWLLACQVRCENSGETNNEETSVSGDEQDRNMWNGVLKIVLMTRIGPHCTELQTFGGFLMCGTLCFFERAHRDLNEEVFWFSV